jgi:phage gp36-like protein
MMNENSQLFLQNVKQRLAQLEQVIDQPDKTFSQSATAKKALQATQDTLALINSYLSSSSPVQTLQQAANDGSRCLIVPERPRS